MSAVHRNAVVGETVTVHGVRDGVLRLEIDVEPAHHAPTVHVHPRAAETSTVLDGAAGPARPAPPDAPWAPPPSPGGADG